MTANLSVLYPFSALVGQDTMKLALLLCAINPQIGGVLLRGEKGTAKSTAVRSLAALLPRIAVREGCLLSCDPQRPSAECPFCHGHNNRIALRPRPLVTLPLNASEDRLLGGIDLQAALKQGRPVLQTGLLAAAHRGFLYIDEVNLLDDHLVDLVLDAAAAGTVVIEREGLSFRHQSRFVLVASMNPEEGELRPQLLDRFGLCVAVSGAAGIGERINLMERREAFDRDPVEFCREWEAAERLLEARLAAAAERLPLVRISRSLHREIGERALDAGAAGHRADLVMAEATRAMAAWHGRLAASREDLDEIVELVLAHRRRDQQAAPPPRVKEPDEPPPSDPPETQAPQSAQSLRQAEAPDPSQAAAEGENAVPPSPEGGGASAEQVFSADEPFPVRRIAARRDRRLRRGSGRRSPTRVAQKQGRYVRSEMDRGRQDFALDATLRAAAPFQKSRAPVPGMAWSLRPQDLRDKVREKRAGHFILFIVDASGSMGARGRMVAAKGAVLSLLLDAYQKRDKVALICFRGQSAEVVLAPTSSIDVAARSLQTLPTGGRTPLAAGLARGAELVDRQLRRDLSARPIVILLTDGRGNVPLAPGQLPVPESRQFAQRWGREARIKFIVIDTESNGLVRFDLARELAQALGAEFFSIEDLRSETLVEAVKRSF